MSVVMSTVASRSHAVSVHATTIRNTSISFAIPRTLGAVPKGLQSNALSTPQARVCYCRKTAHYTKLRPGRFLYKQLLKPAPDGAASLPTPDHAGIA